MPVAAPATEARTLPRSLTERLALLEREGPWQAGSPEDGNVRRKGTRMSFALGFGLSSLAGGAALLALELFPQYWPAAWQSPAQRELLAPSVGEYTGQRMRADAGAPVPTFDVTLRRGDRGEALFPVRLVGAREADKVTIALRGLPPTANLSSGVRRDQTTWMLRLSELDDLRITLGRGTPETFNVTIEVTSRTGLQLAKSVARVRMTDPRSTAPRRASILETPYLTAVASADAVESPSRRFGRAFAALLASAEDLVNTPERSLPLGEGLSALGGTLGASLKAPVVGALAPLGTDRTLWWKMPTLAALASFEASR